MGIKKTARSSIHVKRSTGLTHTEREREHHPDTDTHTHTRQENTPKPPNEHTPQTLNNARRWRTSKSKQRVEQTSNRIAKQLLIAALSSSISSYVYVISNGSYQQWRIHVRSPTEERELRKMISLPYETPTSAFTRDSFVYLGIVHKSILLLAFDTSFVAPI